MCLPSVPVPPTIAILMTAKTVPVPAA
jgi:hypothetical protein